MSRRFTEAAALLGDLLDRHETGTTRPIAYPDYTGFPSVTAADAFIRDVRDAEKIGAVSITWGRGARSEHIDHIRLEAADTLYRHLRRMPATDIADQAYAQFVDRLTLHPKLAETAQQVRSVWSRAKSWSGFLPLDAPKLRQAFTIAQAILDDRHSGLDYRTFSRRVAENSKALERLEGVVVRLLGDILDLPPGAKPREALRTLGLEKFAPPLLVSGPIDLLDADLSREKLLYFGVAPQAAERFRFREPPAYLLTIENFASFNRHVMEADPHRLGATIYVGGYPSLATQHALHTIVDMLPATIPIYHWSDIDPDGAWIFRTIELAAGRPLRPHLMSSDIAESLGSPLLAKSRLRPCPADSGIHALAQYLNGENAKVLEQEELDPHFPSDDGKQ